MQRNPFSNITNTQASGTLGKPSRKSIGPSKTPITREAMIRTLCAVHARSGQGYGVGLGFYVGLRFHVDSRKFRTWGTNEAGRIACERSFELAHSDDPDAATAYPSAPQAGPIADPHPRRN